MRRLNQTWMLLMINPDGPRSLIEKVLRRNLLCPELISASFSEILLIKKIRKNQLLFSGVFVFLDSSIGSMALPKATAKLE